jgi:hypothetical protein
MLWSPVTVTCHLSAFLRCLKRYTLPQGLIAESPDCLESL